MILSEQGEKKVYSDTEKLEKEMLEIAQKYPEDLSQEFIENDSRYTVNNTFSSVRRNLLNWYQFKEKSSVLEVGAGMGALTGCLCDMCDTVVSLEMSQRRADVIRARYSERKNLTIVCDDLFSWSTEQKFDYIVVVGVLEYAAIFCDSETPFHDFVKNLKRFLKEDGVILLAIENRFGLKYWSGAAEDHICKPFVGIEGYKEKGTAVTFSKYDLKKLFADEGFEYQRLYYVLPDYKFPVVIYTDKYAPNALTLSKLAFSYVDNSVLFWNEARLYKDIINNNVQDFFANSFLIEVSRIKLENNQPVYITAKAEARKPYRVTTLIYDDKHIEKIPVHEEAIAHIKKIHENELELSQRGIRILKCEMKNNRLVRPYYEGDTSDYEFHKCLEQNDLEGIKYLIKLLRDNLLMSSESSEQNMLNDIDDTYQEKDVVLKEGYIDMVFSNAFLKNKELIFFDQEWKFSNIPLRFILFLAVRQSYLSFSGKTEITLEYLYKVLEIEECISSFIKLEKYIWEKILYRQEKFYDGDGWYKHYSNDITFQYHEEKLREHCNKLEDTFYKKNAYINELENCIKEKNVYIRKLEAIITPDKEKYFSDMGKDNMEDREVKELIERKARIRNTAYWNMKGIVYDGGYDVDLNEQEIRNLNDEIYKQIKFLEENSTLIPHKALISNSQNSKKIFSKKVLRKLLEKIFGWYYIPLIEQQNVYNQYVNCILKELQQLLVTQEKRIQQLEKK